MAFFKVLSRYTRKPRKLSVRIVGNPVTRPAEYKSTVLPLHHSVRYQA
jgi:hypothetical protein